MQNTVYQKIINGWDINCAKSKALSFLWVLSKTSESVENYDGDILNLRDWYSLDSQDKTLPLLLKLSLSLVILGAIGKLVIEISKLDQTRKILVINSNDLKNKIIIGELSSLISTQYVVSIKFRYLLNSLNTTKLIEDSYRKWHKDNLNTTDITLGRSEWQITEMNKYLESQRDIYGELPFVLNIDDLDRRIDVLMCLHHFQKENLINIEWSDIDYKVSTFLSPSLFKVQVLNGIPSIERHCFQYDGAQDELIYNGEYLSFKKKHRDFIRTFFDLLKEKKNFILTEEIMLGIEPGYADKSGLDKHKGKKSHIYYPRIVVNKAIQEKSGLVDFFGINDENIYLTYPDIIKR